MDVSKIPFDIEKNPVEWAEFVSDEISEFVHSFLTRHDDSSETRAAFDLKAAALIEALISDALARIWVAFRKPPHKVLVGFIEQNEKFHEAAYALALESEK